MKANAAIVFVVAQTLFAVAMAVVGNSNALANEVRARSQAVSTENSGAEFQRALMAKGAPPKPPCDGFPNPDCAVPDCSPPWDTPFTSKKVKSSAASAIGGIGSAIFETAAEFAAETAFGPVGAIIAGGVSPILSLIFPPPHQDCPTQSVACLWHQVKAAAEGYTNFVAEEQYLEQLEDLVVTSYQKIQEPLIGFRENCPDCKELYNKVYGSVSDYVVPTGGITKDFSCSCGSDSKGFGAANQLYIQLIDAQNEMNANRVLFFKDQYPKNGSVYAGMFGSMELMLDILVYSIKNNDSSVNVGNYDSLVNHTQEWIDYVNTITPQVQAARLAHITSVAIPPTPKTCEHGEEFGNCAFSPNVTATWTDENINDCSKSESGKVIGQRQDGSVNRFHSAKIYFELCGNAVSAFEQCRQDYYNGVKIALDKYLTETLIAPAQSWAAWTNMIRSPDGKFSQLKGPDPL